MDLRVTECNDPQACFMYLNLTIFSDKMKADVIRLQYTLQEGLDLVV